MKGLIGIVGATASLLLTTFITPHEGDLLVEKTLNLKTRHPDKGVNEAFSYNIYHYLTYLAFESEDLNVEDNGSFSFSFLLTPEEVFSFHSEVLPEFKGEVLKTTKTKLSPDEGYKILGGLSANGVCHLASFLNWAASEAGLKVKAPVNHNFAPIPEVPKEYGTSIFFLKDGGASTQRQNLYIENPFTLPIYFSFVVSPTTINLNISKFGGAPLLR